ncbi:TrmH family RNA methyltransferase [Siccirubricoccus phaeus]|uniref:TrmH family RNA methyltransferase n=1 Tax=Siccirubricoccus phaeus TaxID=2595053 RepID=UPI001F3AEE72|nr:RNA methyltransferase [Siccirubricoccus phaeus]
MLEARSRLAHPLPDPAALAPDRQSRICGTAPVQALFLRRAEQVARLFYSPERRGVAGPLCAYLARRRRPYREVPPEELERIAGTQHHGGICAIAARRQAEPLTGGLPESVRAAMLHPVLDGIGNPHNLGAIARSAAFLGCRSLFLSADPRQAELSDAAFRTAEGGLEHLAVYRLPGLASLPAALGRPVLTVAAVAAGGLPPEALPRDRPIALVLGNEEQGLRPETLATCEARITLPGSGLVESLNVSAAAAVLLYALRPRG